MPESVLSVLHGTNSFNLHSNKKKDYYHNYLNVEMETGRVLIISSIITKIVIGRVGI